MHSHGLENRCNIKEQYVCTANSQIEVDTMKKTECLSLVLELSSMRERERERTSSRDIEMLLILECGISLAKAGVMVNGCPCVGSEK